MCSISRHQSAITQFYNAGRMNFLELLDGAEIPGAARQSAHRGPGLRQPARKARLVFRRHARRVHRRQSIHRHSIASRRRGHRQRFPASATRRRVGAGPTRTPRLGAAERELLSAVPPRRLSITGITGTNGKTTTSFLLNAMLRAGGRKTALVGTVEYRIEDEHLPCAAHHARSAGAESSSSRALCRPAAPKR